jgi:hypothetical protein
MFYELIVGQFSKTLGNLSAILDKGAAYAEVKKFDVGVLLNSRLAPDQFNLIRQVQIACDTAKFCAARLTDKVAAAPVHADNETTVAELQTRIKSVQDYLAGFKPEDFADVAERHISHPRWDGKYLTGLEFALQHATPNVFFHVTTAYAILRHNGVDLGKKDYLGSLPYKS